MTETEEIEVEVAFALRDKQVLLRVSMPPGATVADVIHRSGVLMQFPEIDLTSNKTGIFSKLVQLDAQVRDRDRIEIYRPLITDPKEGRRRRANAGKLIKEEGNLAPE